MPKRAKGLVSAGLTHLPPGKHADGAGLYFVVKQAGGRFWTLRYMRDGRAREMGLGGFPAVGLSAARHKAKEASDALGREIDPLDARVSARAAAEATRVAEAQARATEARTFRAVAEELICVQSPAWTSGKTLASWRLTLDKHGYPTLGDVPIVDVGREQVIKALSPVWGVQPATARKLQRRIAAVLDYAAANGWRPADNPAHGRVLRLTKALPPMNANGRRQASLPWQRVPAFMATLTSISGASALALRFVALTVLRSSEVRHARWSEFDFAAKLWVVPGRRMKGGRAKELLPHRVPLTPAMLQVLTEAVSLRTETQPSLDTLSGDVAQFGDAVVFGNIKGEALSDAALTKLIQRMNSRTTAGAPAQWRDVDGRGATAHGLRRSFRTWVDDERPEDAAAAEKALAHDEANKVVAAYRGSDLLARRRSLMAAWSEFITVTISKAAV